MKKFCLTIFIIFAAFSFAFATTPTENQKQAIFMMNYAQFVTYKLRTYNNIIALEDEYENLSNNMNFETIQDYDSVTTINNLMDSIYQERKNNKNRERLKVSIEKKMNEALYNSIPQVTTIITGNMNPLMMAINTAKSAGNIFVSYQKYKNKLSEEYDEKMYQFQSLKEEILKNMSQELNTYTFNLMKEYNISDEWRLNGTEIEQILKFTKDSNKERVFTNLKNMSEGRYVQHFPMFWYYLAKSADEIKKDSEAVKYYSRFEEENVEIFRYDRTAVDAYKGKIAILLKNQKANKKEILSKLKFIETNKTSWNDYYFCALVYAQLNDNDNAKRLLERNLNELSAEVDNQFVQGANLIDLLASQTFEGKTFYDGLELSRALLNEIGQAEISLESVENQYKSDTQAYNEALYYYGLNPSSYAVNNSLESLKNISLSSRSYSEKVCQIDIQIPMQWVMSSNVQIFALFVKKGEEKITSENSEYVPMYMNEKESKKLAKKNPNSKECDLIDTTTL